MTVHWLLSHVAMPTAECHTRIVSETSIVYTFQGGLQD